MESLAVVKLGSRMWFAPISSLLPFDRGPKCLTPPSCQGQRSQSGGAEAGPTGYVLYWQLTQLGVECVVWRQRWFR